MVASAGFAFYAANLASYDKTYGTMAGVIVFLVRLWISDLAILLGLEFDAESVRQRAIAGGHPTEAEPYTQPRDTRKWDEEAILARADHLVEAFCRRRQRPEGGVPALPVADLPAPGLGAQKITPVGRRVTVKVSRARRDVARHIREAFTGLPVGSVLTVAQTVAARTSQYGAGEISAGAVAAGLRTDNDPGIRVVPGSSPLSARKIT